MEFQTFFTPGVLNFANILVHCGLFFSTFLFCAKKSKEHAGSDVRVPNKHRSVEAVEYGKSPAKSPVSNSPSPTKDKKSSDSAESAEKPLTKVSQKKPGSAEKITRKSKSKSKEDGEELQVMSTQPSLPSSSNEIDSSVGTARIEVVSMEKVNGKSKEREKPKPKIKKHSKECVNEERPMMKPSRECQANKEDSNPAANNQKRNEDSAYLE